MKSNVLCLLKVAGSLAHILGAHQNLSVSAGLVAYLISDIRNFKAGYFYHGSSNQNDKKNLKESQR